jgi:peptidoglycan hydrolase-like protein with peptidoglycan-binding domain
MRRRRIIASGTVVAVTVAAGVLVLAGDGSGPAGPAVARGAVGDVATVERTDLVDRDTVAGTLGYADPGTLTAGVSGTLTRMPAPGTVVTRGHSLYQVDGAKAAWLLYGELPAWRDFSPGMTDGADVAQLERNLRALGDDPDGDMDVDEDWDWATTAAVERFQDDRGLTEDGTLTKGEVVFRSGRTRIGEAKADPGAAVAPGRQLADLSSTLREVTVDLAATRQQLARLGAAVTVELPTGRTARGRISDVGKVATQPQDENAAPTIAVTITLHGKAAHGTGLDQAPVDVGFAVERRRDVLTVPIKALLARQGGGFAVEVVEHGARRKVKVEPGLYADDRVEVTGDVHEGETVVTAR